MGPMDPGSTNRPSTPPVRLSQRRMVNSIMNWAAMVAMAKYSPLSLRDGMPNIIPTMAAMTPDRGSATIKGIPACPVRMVQVYAPTPRKAACPREICPVNPVRTLSPWHAIIAMPASVMMDTMYLEAISGKSAQAIRNAINQAFTNQVWKTRSSL